MPQLLPQRWLRCLLVLSVFVCSQVSAEVGTVDPALTAGDSVSAPPAAVAQADLPAEVVVPDAFGLVTKMGISLLIVLVVIWLAVQLIRRLHARGLAGPARSYVQVLDRTYLAPKKAICIVQIGSQYLALGVTDSQITRLSRLNPEQTRLALQVPREGGAQVPFASLFRDVRARLSGNGSGGESR